VGGFSAITSSNGWTIAAMGLSIVFAGLATLAVIVSFFPHILSWWNDLSVESLRLGFKGLLTGTDKKPAPTATVGESAEPGEIDDAEEALRLLTAHMGEPFKLPRLLELAERRGLAKPHSTINFLLIKGIIEGGSDGLFRWASGSNSTTPSQSR
jgi:hypothetical protein